MLLLGNDAEFILTRSKVPVSAIGLIGGTKLEPLPVPSGALQEDNVLAEINIIPAGDVKTWEKHINTVTKELKKRLPRGVAISTLASAVYPEQMILHPKAKEFGCDPDINAWTGEENPRPELPDEMQSFRSAGGHIHIGIKGLSDANKRALIRCLDTFVGLQTVILDKDSQRKMLYGKAGAMRYKSYGVEWRTPSNFWIFDAYTRAWMFNAAMFCASNFKNKTISKLVVFDVVGLINSNDRAGCINYLRHLKDTTEFPLHKRVSQCL